MTMKSVVVVVAFFRVSLRDMKRDPVQMFRVWIFIQNPKP